MKHIFLIIFSVFILKSNSQNIVWENSSRTYYKCDTISLTLVLKKVSCVFKNGKLSEEGYLRNGIKDSIWKAFDLDGKLLYSEYFNRSGIINKIEYEKGKITSNVYYKIIDSLNVTPVLTHTFYHKDGKTIKEIIDYDTLSKNNNLVYLKSYNENGLILYEGIVVNPNEDWANKDGVFYFYNNNRLYIKKKYENGNQKVTEEKYYKNGKIEYRFTKIKNKFEGEHILYFKNGSISVYSEFKNGKLHGKMIIYKKDGGILDEGNYINGKRL